VVRQRSFCSVSWRHAGVFPRIICHASPGGMIRGRGPMEWQLSVACIRLATRGL